MLPIVAGIIFLREYRRFTITNTNVGIQHESVYAIIIMFFIRKRISSNILYSMFTTIQLIVRLIFNWLVYFYLR